MSRRLASAVALLAACTVLAGCGPKYVRDTYHESRDIEIVLRGRTDQDPGFEHPATVSAVRMSHILASLDVRFGDQEKKNARTAVVPVEAVYPLGELVSGALSKAKPNQEVVVSAQIRSRKLKVFTEKRLTSFIVYMKNDQLVFHIARVGFPVPKNPNERIREPKPGSEYQDFKVVRSRSIVPIAKQTVAVEWRDAAFRKADAIRLGPGGRVKRRTMLLEEPEEQAPEEAPSDTVNLSNLTPEALRRLADLEEERRRGAIGEAEYQARRREILGGAGR